jgi:branched-chain amino acid transport system ATP-binding protein
MASLFEVERLSIAFGGIRAVEDVSFAVEEGEIFSIIGPNGAGKTSVFNLISRLYDADDGAVRFEGRDITRLPAHAVPAVGIARTFQNIQLFDNATVLDNLMLGRYRHHRANLVQQMLFTPFTLRERLADRAKVEEVIDFLELERHRDKQVAGLPYGVKKVVELGRALALEPRLLLLDEPASGLSPEETDDLAFWIEDIRDDLGVTVLMIEHDMRLVAGVSDRVLAMAAGAVIAEGPPAAIQNHPDVVAAYLGA